jgi:hypothetical protein
VNAAKDFFAAKECSSTDERKEGGRLRRSNVILSVFKFYVSVGDMCCKKEAFRKLYSSLTYLTAHCIRPHSVNTTVYMLAPVETVNIFNIETLQ